MKSSLRRNVVLQMICSVLNQQGDNTSDLYFPVFSFFFLIFLPFFCSSPLSLSCFFSSSFSTSVIKHNMNKTNYSHCNFSLCSFSPSPSLRFLPLRLLLYLPLSHSPALSLSLSPLLCLSPTAGVLRASNQSASERLLFLERLQQSGRGMERWRERERWKERN